MQDQGDESLNIDCYLCAETFQNIIAATSHLKSKHKKKWRFVEVYDFTNK